MFHVKSFILIFLSIVVSCLGDFKNFKFARKIVGQNNERTNVDFHCIPPRPDLNKLQTIQPDPFTTEDPTTRARIFLESDLFSETNGKILYYAILVAEETFEELPKNGTWNENNTDEWPSIPNWNEAQGQKGGGQYQATPAKWQPFLELLGNVTDVTVSVSYILGTGESDEYNYTNGPLKANTKYGLKVRAFTLHGYQDTDIIYFQTLGHLPITTLLIIFSTVFVLTTIILFLSVREKEWISQLCVRTGNRTSFSPVPTALSHKSFLKYSRDLIAFPGRLSNEYHLLGTLGADATTPCLHGQRIDNKQKNRYLNILPFDVTRVELSIVNDDPASDYINASFIKGYSGQIEYIASQGPKSETCHDFWRMIIEQNVELVVMLTRLVENGNEKCCKYFPDSEEQLIFGDIKLACLSLERDEICDKRIILITRNMRQMTVTHLNFKAWPDFGCPENSNDIVKLSSIFRRIPHKGYVVIHCSAGVGRTGTFIAIDIILQALMNGNKINVFKTVLQLRNQRMNMVQTVSQYEFIYKTIADVIENYSRNRKTLI